MYYYQHHIGDYRRDTAHLTLLEHGIYRQLLDLYYISEKPLDANAMRLICARSADEMQAAQTILDEFFEFRNGVYYHKRCDAEICAYHAKSEKAASSAKARWNKNKDLQDANALPTQSERNADGMLTINHKPLTINQEPLTNIKPSRKKTALDNNLISDCYQIDIKSFDTFWSAYPKKTGKDAARTAWKKKKPRIDDVMFALSWQLQSEQWKKNGGQFIPNPATYINQGRWQDEPQTETMEAPF
jgi:uncharacterized protein YdaU (DUF1376 family)